MKRKLFVVSAVGTMLLLASCGTTQTTKSSSSAPAASSAPSESSATTSSIADADKITITYKSTTGKNNQTQLNAYIDSFNAAYPQYKVVSDIYSGSYNALKDDVEKGFSAGTYPDLVQCYPDHVAEYINFGKAVKLDQFIDSTDATVALSAADKADYVTSFMTEGTMYQVTGTYSLPNCKSTELMFWNKDVLTKLTLNTANCGYTVNDGNALGQSYFDNLTWEELFNNLCPAIVAYNDKQDADHKILKTDQAYHSVFAYDSDDNLFITLAEQYGYNYTSVNTTTGKGSADFNNADMKALLKTFNAAANKGYIISKGSAGGNYTNTYFTLQNTLFSVGSTGGVKYQYDSTHPMDVGVARIPHAAGKDAKVISQGPSVCVLDHGNPERSKGAYLFWKWMTTKANSVNWAVNSGYMPVRTSGYTDPDYLATADETLFETKTLDKVMARSAAYTGKVLNEMFTSPVFIGSSACRNAGSALMTYALTKATHTDAEWDAKFNTAYSDATKEIL